MINTIEEYPGQIQDLEKYIKWLEAEVERLRTENSHLQAQIFGGTTK